MHTYDSGSGPLEGNYPEPVYIPVEVPEAPEPAGHGESTATDIPVAAALSPVHEYDGDPADGPRGSILNEENRDLWSTPDNTEDGGPAPVSPALAAPENRNTPLWGSLPTPASEAGPGERPAEAAEAEPAFAIPMPVATSASATPPPAGGRVPVAGSAAPAVPATPSAPVEADHAPARPARPARRPAVPAPDPAEAPSATERPSRAKLAAKMTGEMLLAAVAPSSAAAIWAVNKAHLAESAGRTLNRLPNWANRALRVMDIGAVVALGAAAYRMYTGARGMRDPGSVANAGSLMDIRDNVNSLFEGTNGSPGNASPDMALAGHTTQLETPAGPDFGYEDMNREAVASDPGTGRASNVSDWSKQSYTFWLKEHGATDEQIAKFFEDNPNAVDGANQKFFEGNPEVNTGDAFGGGLQAGNEYDTSGQNDHAWSKAQEWAEANGISATEPDDVPPPPADNNNGGGNGQNNGDGSMKDLKPGNDGGNPNPGTSQAPENPAPSSPAPAEPGDKPSGTQPAQPTSDPSATATADGGNDNNDAHDGGKHEGSGKNDDGKPSAVDAYVVPAILGTAVPAILTATGYSLGVEAAERARLAGIGRNPGDEPIERDDDDEVE